MLSGLVKLQSVPIKGRSSTFLCVASGDWFGEGSALNIERRRYEVVALRDFCRRWPSTMATAAFNPTACL